MIIPRIYRDADGGSRFADAEIESSSAPTSARRASRDGFASLAMTRGPARERPVKAAGCLLRES